MAPLASLRVSFFLIGLPLAFSAGIVWALAHVTHRTTHRPPVDRLIEAGMIAACAWACLCLGGGIPAALAAGLPLAFFGYVGQRIAQGDFTLIVRGRTAPPVWEKGAGRARRRDDDDAPWRASLPQWDSDRHEEPPTAV